MAKLTAEDKRRIVIESAAGSTASELAKKFQVSHTAISKILKDEKSFKKLQDEVSKVAVEPYREKAHNIIRKIMDELPNDLKKATLKDKMVVFDKMIAYYGTPEENSEEVTGIRIEIEDASDGPDG